MDVERTTALLVDAIAEIEHRANFRADVAQSEFATAEAADLAIGAPRRKDFVHLPEPCEDLLDRVRQRRIAQIDSDGGSPDVFDPGVRHLLARSSAPCSDWA